MAADSPLRKGFCKSNYSTHVAEHIVGRCPRKIVVSEIERGQRPAVPGVRGVQQMFEKQFIKFGEKTMRNAVDAILPFREDFGDVLGSLGAEVIFREIERSQRPAGLQAQ